MKFIAGIDGGGTKTRICCRDLEGAEICTKLFGPFNMNGIGRDRFVALLDEICAFLNSVGECAAVCIGSAGISNTEMVRLVSDAMARGGIENYKLVGDNVIAMYGALEGRPGVSFIAGTGSICFGRNASGEEARSGGWGHLIGDEGSAYALGRDALSAVAADMDGYGEHTLITGLLAEDKGLDTRPKIVSYTYSGDKSNIATLSRITEKAALLKDPVALRIIEDNARKMAELVNIVAVKLGLEKTECAMLGGMLENDTCLKAAFIGVMAEKYPLISCIEPKQDACTGAVMLARQMIER